MESMIAREYTRTPLARSSSPPPWNPFSTATAQPTSSAPACLTSSISPRSASPCARKSSVREKIVDDEHAVARAQIFLLDEHHALPAVGVAHHFGGVAVGRYVRGLGFLSKKHRGVKVPCRVAGDGNARCFYGHEFGDAVPRKVRVDILAYLLEKPVIYEMIEKASYFEHLSGIDLAVPEDALLKQFHPYSSAAVRRTLR